MDLSEPPHDDAAAARLLRRAVDLGVTIIDTADRYGTGHNEEVVGAALADRREHVRLCTKVGFVGRPGDARPVDNRPAHLRRACDESLRRLRTDHVDVLLLHRVDPAVPLEDSIGTLVELREAGRTRAIGVSEVGPRTLQAAHTVHPLDVLQIEYSLASRGFGDEMLPLCRALGMELHASSPLGIGLLTASPATLRGEATSLHPRLRRLPRAQDRERRANADVLAELEGIAAEVGCTVPQLTLAWLCHRGTDVVPLPGTRRMAHLEANLAACTIHLDRVVLDRLDHEFPAGRFAGARKTPAQLALTLP
jgi:aryl-alcohol dehydrogenase-like predicted oxidoreductase